MALDNEINARQSSWLSAILKFTSDDRLRSQAESWHSETRIVQIKKESRHGVIFWVLLKDWFPPHSVYPELLAGFVILSGGGNQWNTKENPTPTESDALPRNWVHIEIRIQLIIQLKSSEWLPTNSNKFWKKLRWKKPESSYVPESNLPADWMPCLRDTNPAPWHSLLTQIPSVFFWQLNRGYFLLLYSFV